MLPTPSRETKNVSRYCQMSPGVQIFLVAEHTSGLAFPQTQDGNNMTTTARADVRVQGGSLQKALRLR